VDAGAVSAKAVAAVDWVFSFFVFVGVVVPVSSPSVFNPFLGWLDVSAGCGNGVMDVRIEVVVGKEEEMDIGVVDMIGIELDIVDEGTGVVEMTTTVVGTVVTAAEVV